MSVSSSTLPASRLSRIAQARQLALHDTAPLPSGLVEPWIVRSWQRCMAQGQRPGERVAFESVSTQAMRQTSEANQTLVQAARPILKQLGRTLADTRYFAILTNHDGVVVDVDGPIDRSDQRAAVITRVGVDLSERSVGTTAIGAALRELQPVWLHRGEHFYNDTSVYSCAGTPLFGPDGRCIGMLDLTGVEAPERPELSHLALHSAHAIENALVLQRPHQLLLRLNWSGRPLGEDADGLLTLDADGRVTAANRTARQLLPQLGLAGHDDLHSRDLFALPFEMLFDAARHGNSAIEVPLWSGLRLQVQASLNARGMPPAPRLSMPMAPAATMRPLKEVESDLIRKAVEEARGNVAQAARALGISRATVYRKLGNGNGKRG
ncbi:MAG: helix-turn-helix domain-containing protein [Hylemonella sp.]|nr:helix-turn-helix domain-containing protein [Hylemonella sp.]MDP1937492.1 helix-turn-helix domain-containing protein [Hylemonella sp.]